MRKQREHIRKLKDKVTEFRRSTPISSKLRSDAQQDDHEQNVSVDRGGGQQGAKQDQAQLASLIRSGDVAQIAEMRPSRELAIAAARQVSPALASILAA
jgi:hypothetical protein